jgi:hypothetical protein
MISDRQATAYLTAVAQRSMAERDVEVVDDTAIAAVLADTQTTDTQKATAIRQILGQG